MIKLPGLQYCTKKVVLFNLYRAHKKWLLAWKYIIGWQETLDLLFVKNFNIDIGLQLSISIYCLVYKKFLETITKN